MGIKIFVHAVRLVFNNLGDAVRISAVLYLVPVVLAGLMLGDADPASPSPTWPVGLLLAIAAIAGAFWVAVAWHRFILLDERTAGLLPAFHGSRVLAYFGYSLLLALIGIPIVFGASLLAGGLVMIGGPILAILGVLVGVFAALVVGYRLALILPASSVDRRLRLGEAWEATRGASGDIVVLAFISAICSIAIDLPSLLFSGPLLIVQILWQAITGWLILLVGISILTTLYGHYVEGRPIGD